jgi:hypothetical protein
MLSDLGGLGTFIFSLVAVWNAYRSYRNAKVLQKLEANTDGINRALVKVTGEAEHAKGVKLGRAQVENEIGPS